MNEDTNMIDQKIWLDGSLVSSKSDCKSPVGHLTTLGVDQTC